MPRELLCEIFANGISTNRTLLRVNSWTRNWLSPKVYHTVSLVSWSQVDQFKVAMRNPRNAELVKRLSLDVGQYPVASIIAQCSNLESLLAPAPFFYAIRLGQDVLPQHLTDLTITDRLTPYLRLNLPPTITRLTFTEDAPLFETALTSITALPKLQYLAFRIRENPLPFAADPSPRLITALDTLLAARQGGIKLTVISLSREADTRYWPALRQYPNDEKRLVILYDAQGYRNWWTTQIWAAGTFWRELAKFAKLS